VQAIGGERDEDVRLDALFSLATESRLAASVSTVALRTMTGPPPKRPATIPAAPFASLSKTLWSPNSPKATTATFGPVSAAAVSSAGAYAAAARAR
jgi:hypothetical protein